MTQRSRAAARIVIPHADDVGMCHGANQAFMDIVGKGFVTTGSVMVPCPWFNEIADWAVNRNDVDLGIHLTLTSEWPHYRWGPISTRAETSGLLDADGYFPRRVPELRSKLDRSAAECEMRAQIERVFACGITPSHIDTHMGAALIPELLETTIALAHEYQLPLLLPRAIEGYLEVLNIGPVAIDLYREHYVDLVAANAAFIDYFIMTPWVASDATFGIYTQMIDELQPGVTFFALHPNTPGDIEFINPIRAHCRIDEYRLATDERFIAALSKQDIQIEGFNSLVRLQLEHP